MENKQNILIVCFSFPSFPGIGGRRWAKFAKHLAKNNFNVHVLAAENTSNKTSAWINDVRDKKIKITTFPLGLSKVFSFYPANFFEKLIYKILTIGAKLFIKGNKQDKIWFVKDTLLREADKLISINKINTLIVTIPPYKLAYYLLPLKKKYPGLKFCVDYRDPWTDNRSYHGFANISSSDLAAESEFEKQVLLAADVVLDVNQQSLELLKKKIFTEASFVHLPNGFDNDDYEFTASSTPPSDIVRFVYTGSFYPNLIYLLKPLVNTLKKLEASHPDLYKRLSFDLYGNMDHKAIEELKNSNCSAIKFHGDVPQKEVHEKISQADFCLLFSAQDHHHALNTKFYEYLYFRKPILYFGNKGHASDYITTNGIGFLFEPKELEDSFYYFLINNDLKEFTSNPDVDIHSFEVGHITKTLIKAING